MLKKILVFLVFITIVFLPYVPAVAGDFGISAFSKGAGYSTDGRDVYAIANTVITTFLSVIAIILFILVFYGGIRWMTAMGNDEKVQKAKDIVEAAAIGLAIIIASYGITYFIFNKLVGK